MKPVYQSVEGYPYGDCIAACWATLLGKQLSEIPRFDPAACVGSTQFAKESAWLLTLGLLYVEFRMSDMEEIPEAVLSTTPAVYHTMSGISPRGLGHRCLGYAGRLAFDPHPSQTGLISIYAVGFIIRKSN